MTKIEIPKSVIKIESGAFLESRLKDVYYEGTMEEWKNISIEIEDNDIELKDATIHILSDGFSGCNGLVKSDGIWGYYSDGVIDASFTGMARNEYGWWYVKEGALDKTYIGMAKNQYGWWYMKKGKLDTSFEGIAQNQYGKWYMKGGKLQSNYNGTKTFNGVTYTIKKGKVID